MKKIFTKLMLLAVAAAALVSCENNYEEQAPVAELTQTVTLLADKTAVRTELIDGVPNWSKGDAVGVYLEDHTKHYKFENTAEGASPTATFKGQTAVANTLFVYYPYTSNGVADNGAKVDIPVNQEPTATSFDGKADIMLAKPVTLDEEGKQVGNLEFARLGAIVKVVLKDKTGNLAGQHVSSLTMTTAAEKAYLTGRVYIDVKNQELGELYNGGSTSVNATYTEATQYEVNGENATYLIVYPQTLAAESTLSFEASTDGYAISKSIELGQDIVLAPGKVTTLNVSLAADNLVKEETGLALPFEDDFARFELNAGEPAITSLGDNYSAIENIYQSKEIDGAIKFGTSSKAGSITTVALNLSQPFTVIVGALGYKDTETVMKVTVGEVSKTINLTTTEAYYGVEFEAATKKSAVTIETAQNGKRFHLSDLQVVAGHDVVLPTLPPVLTVTKSEISVSHEGATETFTYGVANPVDDVTATVTVTEDVDWITIADNNGTVTVTVAANDAEEAREGVITVTYGELTKTVTVNQNGKPAAGEQTAQYVKVTSTSDITSGTYLIVYESKSYVFNGGLATASIDAIGNYKSVTISNNTIESNATTDAMAFVYDASNKSFKGVGGAYIGRTANSNGMDEHATTVRTHTSVTISNGNAIITSSGGPNLQFYDATGSSRFRYFASAQKAIQLYKLVSGEGGGSTPEPEPATPEWGTVTAPAEEVAAAGGSASISYSVTNAVEGKFASATTTATWITDFAYTADKVTFNVAANTGAARTATVTLSYEGITETKNVTVSQAAGNTGGGTTVKGYKKVTTVTSGKKYIIVGGGTAKAMVPATGATKFSAADVTITNDVIESNATTDAYAVTFTTNSDGYKIKFVKSGVTYYIAYSGSSTNFAVGTSTTYYWKVAAASKAGTFAITASQNATRAITWRAGTTNKFAPYATSNINGSEYYNVDLYEYQD